MEELTQPTDSLSQHLFFVTLE